MKIPAHIAIVMVSLQLLGGATASGVERTNELAIVGVRELTSNETMVKNAHAVLVTITNASSQLVKEEGRGRYVVVLARFNGPFVDELLVPAMNNTTNRPRFATGGGAVREIPPNSSFSETVYLEQELRLGQRIPSGEYWALLLRRCGPVWDDLIAANPIRITIE